MSYTGDNSSGYIYSTVNSAYGSFKLTDSQFNTTNGSAYIVVGPIGYSGSITFDYQSVNTNTNLPQPFDGSQSVVKYYVNSSFSSLFPDGIGFDLTSLTPEWTIIGDWQTSNVQQSGSQTINFIAGDYIAILLTGNGEQSGTISFNGFLQPDGSQPLVEGGGGGGGGGGACFSKNSKVLMANGEYKKISEIKRYDVVIQDLETREIAIVSRNVVNNFISNCVIIKKNYFNNNENIICTENHPIWTKDNNRRILAKDLPNVEKNVFNEEFYNLQFDEEGTYIVEGIKVDSLSPYHKHKRLPYELFIDKTKFIPNRRVTSENQEDRNKPKLL